MHKKRITFFVMSMLICCLFTIKAAVVSYSKNSITEPGVTRLKRNVTINAPFQISTSNAVLDMNGKTIRGGILIDENIRNVTIKNGIVDSIVTTTQAAIHIKPGCQQIQIQNVKVKNGARGIFFDQAFNSVVENCEIAQTNTGMVISQSAGIIVENTVADCNTDIGYQLVSSTSCVFRECKALSTGEGNSNLDADIIGFSATSGNGNIFERCIANSTQGLTVTGFSSVVAGFALRGSESCTKIIESESANATSSVEGVTVPYGILLEGTFSGLTSVTSINPGNGDQGDSIGAINWSTDGKYFAIGGTPAGSFQIFVYRFDRLTQSLTQLDRQDPGGDISDISWSPDNVYLASGGQGPSNTFELNIYKFESITEKLSHLIAVDIVPSTLIKSRAVDWSPDGKHLVLGVHTNSGSVGKIFIYKFDAITETITETDSIDTAEIASLQWSPDGKYVAVGARQNSQNLFVYRFDESTESLVGPTTAGSTAAQRSVKWSSDGKYLASTGFANAANLEVYRFDRAINSLILIDGDAAGGNGFDVEWSPDGTFLAAGRSNFELKIYEFDRGIGQLILLETLDIGTGGAVGVSDIAWSPDGTNLAVGLGNLTSDDGNDLIIYEVLGFPSKNVIKNNTVYCNSGNSCPGGIGISGSSICNYIVGNTAYSNPIPQTNIEGGGPIVPTNYAFVTNVFNQLFGNGPTGLQNISVGGCEPICIPDDIDLILKQTKLKVCNVISRLDIFQSKLDSFQPDTCVPTRISAGPITAEGSYCLSADASGPFAITASNVVLDLNGRKIINGVTISNQDQITIMNGVIEGTSTGNGLLAQNSTNINLEDVTIKNSLIGANFDEVTGGFIKRCTFTQNTTGVELDQSHKIVLESCMASSNINAGFCLLSSTTNCLRDCKALSTGQGNIQTANATIFGFVSTDGSGNIFERCIANSTQALFTTDYDSLVAGFALRGSESCTKIIDSESSNATTAVDGVTVPYGILLESTLSLPLTVTTEVSVSVGQLNWNPDGKYLAASTTPGLNIYSFDRNSRVLTLIAQDTTIAASIIRDLQWRPAGNRIAVANDTTNVLQIFKFEPDNNTVTLIAQDSSVTDTPSSATWSPDGIYIAVADFGTPDALYIFEFNIVTSSLTLVAQDTSTLSSPAFATWSPDGKFIAVIDSGTPDALYIFEFNRSTNTLTVVAQDTATLAGPFKVAWSPDGKFLAVEDLNFGVGNTLYLFEFNRSNNSLTLKDQVAMSGLLPSGVVWSPDGRYIVANETPLFGTAPGFLRIFEFDRSTEMLIALVTNNEFKAASVDWSPDGQYLALDDEFGNLLIFEILSFPSKNVITNNTVYCNSGNECPGGVGISGSSIANYIVSNTAYSNPINPSIVGSNYQFVTNVFNQLFGNGPTGLQNISLDSCEPICTPENLALLLKQSCKKVDDLSLCAPTFLTSTDIVSGTISITESGNYCLSEDLTTDIAITTTCVFLDLNSRCLTGVVDVATSEHVMVSNGNVKPAAGASATPVAGIVINSSSLYSTINKVTIECADETVASAVGREGIQIAGHNTQVLECTIKSGSATGADNDGGDGILVSDDSEETLIQDCIIRTGDGGNSSSATIAGGGGHGIATESNARNVEIIRCTIEQTGDGGDNSSSGDGGPGGNGIEISSGSIDVAVSDCTIRNTGAGGSSSSGTPGLGGKAVNDQVTTTANLSQVFSNFAHNISNATKFDLQAAGIEKGIETPNPPTSTVINPFANAYVS